MCVCEREREREREKGREGEGRRSGREGGGMCEYRSLIKQENTYNRRKVTKLEITLNM